MQIPITTAFQVDARNCRHNLDIDLADCHSPRPAFEPLRSVTNIRDGTVRWWRALGCAVFTSTHPRTDKIRNSTNE